MTLAYTFWHRPKAAVPVAGYERDLRLFHERLAAEPISGFVDSYSLRVPDLSWLPGGGYEDWYLVEDFTSLGRLNQAAVDAARLSRHDPLAAAVSTEHGAGGVYALTGGSPGADPGAGPRAGSGAGGWFGWFGKRDGVGYPEFRAELADLVAQGVVTAAWQRQMVLGPASEFRLEAAGPVRLSGARLISDGAVIVSG